MADVALPPPDQVSESEAIAERETESGLAIWAAPAFRLPSGRSSVHLNRMATMYSEADHSRKHVVRHGLRCCGTIGALKIVAAAIMIPGPLAIANSVQAQSPAGATPEVLLSELSRLSPADLGFPLSDDPRVTGGDGLVYVAGFEDRGRWATIRPSEGELHIFDVAAQRAEVQMALGSEDGRRFVMHDGRISVFPGAELSEYVIEVSGQLLAGRAWPEGPVGFLFWNGSQGMTVVLFEPSRLEPRIIPIDVPADFTPGLGIFGENALFVTNRYAPYDVVMLTLEGDRIGRWVRDAPWVKMTEDEFGRNHTHVFAVHEMGSYALIVTAVREDGASGVFGGYDGFSRMNSFVMELIHTGSGTVIETSIHEEPPFHGSVGHDLVFRIVENRMRSAREIVFLVVSIPQ